MDINELRRARAAIIKQARDLVDKATTEKRDLTDEENTGYECLLAEADKMLRTIEREEQLQGLERGLGQPQQEPIRPDPSDPAPGQQRVWKSFGEQLRAVVEAARPGGTIDSRLTTRAASGASESVPSDGGFLVQEDFVSELLKRTYETGVLASRCRKIPISPNATGLKINAVDETSRVNGSRWGGIQAYWTNEADTPTATKPKFRQMNLILEKLTGLCYATDELLQDAAALESVLTQGFAEEFGFKIDDALISGTGSGQPLGILNSPALVTVAKETGQSAATVVAENIINMRARLWARSRPNSVWLINQDVEKQLHQLSLPVGTGGIPVYLPANGLSGLPYDTLYGRPVIPIEQCSTLGTVGDIILADFSQYLLIDKGAMQSAASIHVRFLYDESVFRFIYRVDGEPIWNKPLTPYKGTNTLSPFVALATRA